MTIHKTLNIDIIGTHDNRSKMDLIYMYIYVYVPSHIIYMWYINNKISHKNFVWITKYKYTN